jgi:hypothetical protein
VRKRVLTIVIFVTGNQNIICAQSSCVFLHKRVVKKINVRKRVVAVFYWYKNEIKPLSREAESTRGYETVLTSLPVLKSYSWMHLNPFSLTFSSKDYLQLLI